jgi:hypothetical protein
MGASHPLITEILPGNVIMFRFDNINLPDSFSNPAASTGYVLYEVEQNANLPDGTLLTNTAYIYFDFNAPIVTNTVLNTIDSSVGINETSGSGKGTVYPNPAENILHIISDKISVGMNVTVTDITGREIFHNTVNQPGWIDVNTANFKKGYYLVKIFNAKGERMNFKFVKN